MSRIVQVSSDVSVSGTTRSAFVRAIVVGGVGFAFPLAYGGTERARSAPSAEQDVRILNFALILERLQAELYGRAAEAGLYPELLAFARTAASHERAHVGYLEDALGTAAEPAPEFDLGDALTDAGRFAEVAKASEDLAVAAYNGQVANLTPGSLKAATRIVSVDARHAAWIRAIRREAPAEDAIDDALGEAEVRAQLTQGGFLP
jgi:Ferritin-like domain